MSMRRRRTDESGHFRFAQTGHSHIKATPNFANEMQPPALVKDARNRV